MIDTALCFKMALTSRVDEHPVFVVYLEIDCVPLDSSGNRGIAGKVGFSLSSRVIHHTTSIEMDLALLSG